MKKCQVCGVEYGDEANFCTSCGAKLDAAPQAAPAEEYTEIATPVETVEKPLQEENETVMETSAESERVPQADEKTDDSVEASAENPNAAALSAEIPSEDVPEASAGDTVSVPAAEVEEVWQGEPVQAAEQEAGMVDFMEAKPEDVVSHPAQGGFVRIDPPMGMPVNNGQEPMMPPSNTAPHAWNGTGISNMGMPPQQPGTMGQPDVPPTIPGWGQPGMQSKPEPMVLGIIAFVLSIFALLFSWTMIVPLFFGLGGIVLGIIQLVKSRKKGFAIAALAISLVSLVIALIVFVFFSQYAYGGRSYDRYDDDSTDWYDVDDTYDSDDDYLPVGDYRYVVKDYGSFEIPKDWEESDLLEDDDMALFVPEGTSLALPSSNVSTEHFYTDYAQEDSASLLAAVQANLSAEEGVSNLQAEVVQIGDYDVAKLTFNQTINTREATTTQYYVMLDYETLYVDVTNFFDGIDAVSVGEHIISSYL